jgi:hypothetical protein
LVCSTTTGQNVLTVGRAELSKVAPYGSLALRCRKDWV